MTTDSDNSQELTSWQEVKQSLGLKRLTFGRMIWSFRHCESLTQQAVADQLGIRKQLLSAYENNRQLPSLAQGARIAQAIGLDLSTALATLIQDQIEAAGLPLYQVEIHPMDAA